MAKRIAVVPGVVIYQRAGGIWWLDVHQDRKRSRKSLKTAQKAKALTLAHALAEEILNQEWNVAAATTLTIERAIERYRESKSDHSEETRNNVRHILGKFAAFVKGRSVEILDRVRVEHVEAFREWARAQRRQDDSAAPVLSLITVRNWIQKVSMFFRWALDRGYVRRNPARGVLVKVPPRLPKPALTFKQMADLIAACEGLLKDLVLLLVNTGLRIGDPPLAKLLIGI